MRTNALTLLAVLALITACKREADDEPPPTPPPATSGTFQLSMSFTSGDDPFNMDDTYHDGAGHAVRFSKLKFYMSDFHLADDLDNTVGEFHEAVVLADAGAASNVFVLGTMAPAHVHEVHVTLGLEAELNHDDPADAEYPLDQLDMHSGSTTDGYRFLLMEGDVDGNGDGDFDDAEDIAFMYHCSSDDLLRETHVHLHGEVLAGQTVTSTAKIDVSILISGLDLLTDPVETGLTTATTTAMDSLAVAIDEVE